VFFEKSAKNVKTAMEKKYFFQKNGLEKWAENSLKEV